jgi:hypothetical protein
VEEIASMTRNHEHLVERGEMHKREAIHTNLKTNFMQP